MTSRRTAGRCRWADSDATFQIDRDETLLGSNYPLTAGVVADASLALRGILEALPADRAPPSSSRVRLRRPPAVVQDCDDAPLRPATVLAAVERALPGAFWTSDIGEHCAHVVHNVTIDRPDRFRAMLGLASMGSGIGAAIGVRHARRDVPVVCVCGDGGFAMHAGDLLTCVQNAIDVVFVVFNDGKWNMVEHGFRAVYGKTPAGLPSAMADFAEIARGFGAIGVRADRASDLAPERLRELASLGRPVVIDARIDPLRRPQRRDEKRVGPALGLRERDMKRAGILGLGLWVPDTVRGNDAWPPAFSEAFHDHQKSRRAGDFTVLEGAHRPYDELYRRYAGPHEADPFKGARERRVADPGSLVVEGDAEAARRALRDARVKPPQVDLVLSSALVQDRLVPNNGPAIQHLTGCENAPGIGVESYCSAALAQLDVATALVEAGRAKHVLCVQSHQIARANDLSLPFSPMFGDASAAFVVGEVPPDRGLVHTVRGGMGSLAGAVTFEYSARPGAAWYRDAEGPVRPGSEDLEGARFIGRNMLGFAIDTIREVCDGAAVPIDAVAAVAMMQPLPWFQRAVADGLGLPPDRAPSTYDRYAHVGGAGVVANLMEARRLGLLRDGVHVVLYAHGAGVTRFGSILRWSVAADAR